MARRQRRLRDSLRCRGIHCSRRIPGAESRDSLPCALLESATINGARALGFEADFGSIEAGKRDSLISVDLPGPVLNVEEYLVSGIEPADIRWLAASER